ncbi:MAG: D-sedoheptulose-7-phosphate isomerase [Janthinobacterium lividum]
MNKHLETLSVRHPALLPCIDTINRAFTLLRDSLQQDGTLFLAGNGGSAADADHLTGELLKGFCNLRPLTADARSGLRPEIADKLQGGIRAIPLTGFPAFTTAFSNDVDPNLVWAQLIHTLGRPGDVFIGLSTSGNAKNVCAAAEIARARGLKVMGLTGQSGGNLKDLSNVCIRVPATETYHVQELHLPTYHCLALMLEDEFFTTQQLDDDLG